MHIYAKKYGLFGTNGFVGGGIPSSVGVGLSSPHARHRPGDGLLLWRRSGQPWRVSRIDQFRRRAEGPGRFRLRKQPVRHGHAADDGHGQHRSRHQGRRLRQFPAWRSTATTCWPCWEAARVAVERARKGDGPTLIEAKTYRTVGHHEGDQLVGTYRTQEELDLWKTRCPIRPLQAEAVGLGPRDAARSDGHRSSRRQGRARVDRVFPPCPASRSGQGQRSRLGRAVAPATARHRSQRPKPSCKVIWKPCATRWPRKCGAIRTRSIWARGRASAAAVLPTPRACGTSSAENG